MVKGDMKQYILDTISGDVVYISRTPNIKIGGLSSSKAFIPLELRIPEGVKIGKSVLEIALKVPRENITWRLKLNGVPITREFKPNDIVELKNFYFAKLVYDVTPIIKSMEDKRRNRCSVLVKYEGSEELFVSHVALLTAFETEDARSSVSMVSGALALEPGETANISIRHKPNTGLSGELKTVFISPSTQARISIGFNGEHLYLVEGIVGGDELTLKVNNVSEVNNVEIKHLDTPTLYYPKELLLSTILLLQTHIKTPKLEVKDIILPEKMSRGDKIKAVIVNNGESKPDKALVTLIHLGTTVYQEKLPALNPGEETVIEIPVNIPRGEYSLILRIIWRKLTKTYFVDKRINVSVL